MKKRFLLFFSTVLLFNCYSKKNKKERIIFPFKLFKKIKWDKNIPFQASDVYFYDNDDTLVKINGYENKRFSIFKYFSKKYRRNNIIKISIL